MSYIRRRRQDFPGPFLKYFGSKWKIAPLYPTPEHQIVIEPFAGGAGYSVRHHDRDVMLVERDPTIAAIWRWLIAASPEDVRAIPLLRRGQTTDEAGMTEVVRDLVGFWVNAATSTPCRQIGGYARNWKSSDVWNGETRERLAKQVALIKHWRIVEGSYEDAPDIEATWFVDPPYQQMGRHYRHHDIDYARLADWVRSRRGLVIACENVGATWLPFVPFVNSASAHKRRSVEAIYVQHSNG